MPSRIIHPAFRVGDINKSVAFYDKYFDWKLAASADLGPFVLNFLADSTGEVELELTDEKSKESPIGMNDGGFDHLAISVDDVEAQHKRMTDDGLNPTELTNVEFQGSVLARLFFVNDPDGYRLEIIQREGRWA